MADIRTSYAPGRVTTETGGADSAYTANPDLDFFRGIARRALRGGKPAGPRAPAYVSGTGPITTIEGPRVGGTGAGSDDPRRHRFVRSVHGANIVGGNVETGAGPGAVYAGSWDTPGTPGVRLAGLPSQWQPQNDTDDDAQRIMAQNAMLDAEMGRMRRTARR